MDSAAMIRCEECGRDFSFASIKIKIKQAGEYQAGYFPCPYCGKKYLTVCTDSEQEKRIGKFRRLQRRRRAAIRKELKRKTIKKYEWEERKLQREITERNEELREIGRRILEGKRSDEQNAGAGDFGASEQKLGQDGDWNADACGTRG